MARKIVSIVIADHSQPIPRSYLLIAVAITTKIVKFGEIPNIRRVGSIILDNTATEHQWFYPEDFGYSIWNTVDKLSLKCWGRKALGG